MLSQPSKTTHNLDLVSTQSIQDLIDYWHSDTMAEAAVSNTEEKDNEAVKGGVVDAEGTSAVSKIAQNDDASKDTNKDVDDSASDSSENESEEDDDDDDDDEGEGERNLGDEGR